MWEELTEEGRIRAEISETEDRIFINEMEDRWTEENFKFDKEMHEKLKKLEEELELCKKRQSTLMK